jgi:hypothetical protein
METVRIRDPGWKKSRIRDKYPGSATLSVSINIKNARFFTQKKLQTALDTEPESEPEP